MSEDSSDLDSRKLALDERRLAFEIQQYKDGEDGRAAELEKLRLDIRLGSRPFYGNPNYLGPLATICVALLGGFFAFGTNLLNLNVASLQKEKARLAQENGELVQQKEQLTGEITKAKSDIIKLNSQETEFAKRLPLQRADGLLRVMVMVNALSGPIAPTDPSYEELLRTIKDTDAPSSVESLIQNWHDDVQTSPLLKPALSTVMYKATRESLWKRRIQDEVLAQIDVLFRQHAFNDRSVRDVEVYMAWLRDASIFSPAERAAYLKRVYTQEQKARMKPDFDSDRADSLEGYMSSWDADALALYRDPWIDKWFNKGWGDDATYEISPEGAAIQIITSIAKQTAEKDPQSMFLPNALRSNCPFPADVPICRDAQTLTPNTWLHVPTSRVTEYVHWEQQNQRLVELFYPVTGPGHDQIYYEKSDFVKLQSIPNDVFRDIVLKRWVTNDRIPF
jgi:hypothetical protein